MCRSEQPKLSVQILIRILKGIWKLCLPRSIFYRIEDGHRNSRKLFLFVKGDSGMQKRVARRNSSFCAGRVDQIPNYWRSLSATEGA